MKRNRLALAALALFCLVRPSFADDAGGFVVRLGQDTTSVETYNRSASRLEVNQVGRAPRVLRRHFVYQFDKGELSRLSMVVTAPGSTTPTQTIDATFAPDSMRMVVQSGTAPARNSSMALPPGTVVTPQSSQWTMFEGQTMKLARGRSDSLRAPQLFLGATSMNWLTVSRLGRDSVTIWSDHGDLFHARVDRAGRLLGVLPISGTGKFAAERVANLDLEAYASSFAAREKAGTGLGVLSPRDTVQAANAGGASLWLDYGRPSKRGRTIFGNVVPYGEVWRTGANAATQFRTDKALAFGDVTVPAGFYTLWTLPTASGWKLIVNGETGQWGTAHDPKKDLFTIDMQVTALADPVEHFTIQLLSTADGGLIQLDWDTVRATAAFKTQP